MNPVFAFVFGTPGPLELTIVGIIALLIFGKRLPEIARAAGSSIVEFKRGFTEVNSEVNRYKAEAQREINQIQAEGEEALRNASRDFGSAMREAGNKEAAERRLAARDAQAAQESDEAPVGELD